MVAPSAPADIRQLPLPGTDPVRPKREEVMSAILSAVHAGQPVPELRVVAEQHGLAAWFAQAMCPHVVSPYQRYAARRDRSPPP